MMERQLASLTGLVHKALQTPSQDPINCEMPYVHGKLLFHYFLTRFFRSRWILTEKTTNNNKFNKYR